jgi:hypothetical protein
MIRKSSRREPDIGVVTGDELPDYETYKAQFKDEPEFVECKQCAELNDSGEFDSTGARWCSDGHIWIPIINRKGRPCDVRGCDGKME